MYAYDLDLTQRITPGDAIEILQTDEEDGGHELLYVALSLNGVTREFFRYQLEDGTFDFYDPEGETGKRFIRISLCSPVEILDQALDRLKTFIKHKSQVSLLNTQY